MSAVFDFSDSLNDVVPVSPILLSVDVMRKGRELFDGCIFGVSFFCLHHSN